MDFTAYEEVVIAQLVAGQKFLGQYINVEFMAEAFGRCIDRHAEVESPAEAIFLAWWEISGAAARLAGGIEIASIHPQVEVECEGRCYRLDFQARYCDPLVKAAAVRFNAPLRLAVEIDGHDFHERTKEQVTHRDRRDRALQNDGWQILHFSGPELFGNPLRCATEVRVAVVSHYERLMVNVNELINHRGAT